MTHQSRLNEKHDDCSQHILELEHQALQRWCHGDPSGFIEIVADDVVYFDPFIDRRIDGRKRLIDYYEPLRGKIHADRFEIINPLVQLTDSMAVLTFNFLSQSAGGELHWNCTEVYRRDSEDWRIIQSHWSFTKRP